MATFDYFKAIWKNGPGVVSNAPPWVLDEIARELPVWMNAHPRELVGVHLCAQSGLVLGILVSPSAFGSDGSLETSRYGSFIHVFATDHPKRAMLRVDDARALFESTYGAPISDSAVRQQRNFMLLDFPYHEELAGDLFIEKDRVEGGLDLRAPESSSAVEEAATDSIPLDLPDEPLESRPIPARSLSSLLTHGGPDDRAREEDALPFDQGLSYEEVIAGMRERLYGKSAAVESERPLAVRRDESRDDSRTEDAHPFDQGLSYAEVIAGMRERLYGKPSVVDPDPDPDPENALIAPPDLVKPAASGVEAAEVDARPTDSKESEDAHALPIPVSEQIASQTPRRALSPTFAVAGLLVVAALVGGVMVSRLWERAPEEAGFADHKVPATLLPEVSSPGPSLQPMRVAPPFDVTTPEIEPNLPSIEPVMSPRVDEAHAALPVLAAVKPKSKADAVGGGPVSRVEPVPSSVEVGSAPPTTPTLSAVPSVVAPIDVAIAPEVAREEESSSATAESAPPISAAVTAPLTEPFVEVIEVRAATSPGETPSTRAIASDVESSSAVPDRGAKKRDIRRARERKRVLGQINRYR